MTSTELLTTLVTEGLSATELRNKISALSSILNSVDSINTKITAIIRSATARSSSIISCSSFVSLVSQFLAISSDASEADTISELAATLTAATVDSCSAAEVASLQDSQESLTDISSQINSKINIYKAKLSSLLGDTTAGEIFSHYMRISNY